MFDPILDRSPVALPGVTPVVLSNELGFGTFIWNPRLAARAQAKTIPSLTRTPAVLDAEPAVRLRLDAVRHGQRHIGLVVNHSRDGRDGPPWNNLPNKHHASPG